MTELLISEEKYQDLKKTIFLPCLLREISADKFEKAQKTELPYSTSLNSSMPTSINPQITRILKSIFVKKQTWTGWKEYTLYSIYSKVYLTIQKNLPVHINPAKNNWFRSKAKDGEVTYVIRYCKNKIYLRFNFKLRNNIFDLFNIVGLKCFTKPANFSEDCELRDTLNKGYRGRDTLCPCKNCRHWFVQTDGLYKKMV